MRQQEANQFDKGMNLDTNPIAMDNHTLTGALNATMITRNGNELVLQNDMGNARVDQAQLPEGYVPVGMKEHGGIVYVASYNPIKGESQIGCFPSPQRNISSEDTGLTGVSLNIPAQFIESGGIVKQIQKKALLIDEILRAGDKFIIVSTDFGDLNIAIGNNLIDLKVVIQDSEGNSIDITSQLKDYTNNTYSNFKKILNSGSLSNYSDYYNIYKNKISGKLYLQEELILPSYITAEVEAETNGNQVFVTFTPNAFNSDGTEWNTNVINHYDLTVKNKSNQTETLNSYTYTYHQTSDTIVNSNKEYYQRSNQTPYTYTLITNPTNNNISSYFERTIGFTYLVDSDEELTYELYPVYKYNGSDAKIEKLKRTGVINVASIGSGKVDFTGEFRYYNDWVKQQIMIDYSLQAYIENSAWFLKTLDIQAYDIENLFNSSGVWIGNTILGQNPNNEQIKVSLPVSNYFGSYSQMLTYKANPSGVQGRYLDSKHYYIGRIHAVTENRNNSSNQKDYFSPWYAIITSTITNDDYLNSSDNMYPLYNMILVDKSVTTAPVQNTSYYTRNEYGNYVSAGNISSWTANTDYYYEGEFNNKLFELTWNTEFSREDVGSNDGDLVVEGAESNLITKQPSSVNNLIPYITTKQGKLKYKYSAETTVNTHESFPFTVNFNPSLTINQPTYSQTVGYSGNETIYPTLNSGIYQTGDQENSCLIKTEQGSIPTDNSSFVKYALNNDELTINYGLKSQFFSRLKENPNNSSLASSNIERYKFQLETQGNAFVPYTPLYNDESNENKGILENLFGTFESFNTNSDGKITDIYPHNWFNYCLEVMDWDDVKTRGGGTDWSTWKTNVNHYIGITQGPISLYGKPTNTNNYRAIDTTRNKSKYSLKNWTDVSVGIVNNIGQTPFMVFWYGIWNPYSNLSTSETLNSDGPITQYCIPMIKGSSGNYYILRQWGNGNNNKGILMEIIKAFNTIYIEQPEQRISFDYWTNRNDIDGYIYTLPYNININSNVSVVSTENGLALLNINDAEISNFNQYNKDNQLASYYHFPKFKLSVDTKTQMYSDSISAPDQSVKIAMLLDVTSPIINKCAIIKDKNGSTVITNAYKFIATTKSAVPLKSDHIYLLCGYQENSFNRITENPGQGGSNTAILVDINDSNSTGINYAGGSGLGKYGLEVAKAFKNKQLRIGNNYNSINYKFIEINESETDSLTINYWLGGHHENHDEHMYSRRKISDIAAGYTKDLKLLNTTNGATSVTISNF